MDTLVPFVVRNWHRKMAGVAKLPIRPELLGEDIECVSSDFIDKVIHKKTGGLGGGNSNILYVHPCLGKMDPI